MKRWVYFSPLVVLAVAIALFAGFALKRKTAQITPDALVGRSLPEVMLQPLSGGAPLALPIVARGPALVNVFASWCVPCAIEHPQLMRLRAEGVRIVGVAYKDAEPATAAFLRRLGDPYADVVTDRTGTAGIELGISGVPETFVVNARGLVIAKHSGPMTQADADKLSALLKDTP